MSSMFSAQYKVAVIVALVAFASSSFQACAESFLFRTFIKSGDDKARAANFSDAVQLYLSAENEANKDHDNEELLLVWTKLADSQQNCQRFAEAQDYLTKIHKLEPNLSSKNPSLAARIGFMKARNLVLQSKYDQAEKDLKECIEQFEHVGENTEPVLLCLAEVYDKTGQPLKAEALRNLPQALKSKRGGDSTQSNSAPPTTLLETIVILEQQAFAGRTFRGETIPIRLSRLESTVFGKTFPQLDLPGRINRLVEAIPANNRSASKVLNPFDQHKRVRCFVVSGKLNTQYVSEVEERLRNTWRAAGRPKAYGAVCKFAFNDGVPEAALYQSSGSTIADQEVSSAARVLESLPYLRENKDIVMYVAFSYRPDGTPADVIPAKEVKVKPVLSDDSAESTRSSVRQWWARIADAVASHAEEELRFLQTGWVLPLDAICWIECQITKKGVISAKIKKSSGSRMVDEQMVSSVCSLHGADLLKFPDIVSSSTETRQIGLQICDRRERTGR